MYTYFLHSSGNLGAYENHAQFLPGREIPLDQADLGQRDIDQGYGQGLPILVKSLEILAGSLPKARHERPEEPLNPP